MGFPGFGLISVLLVGGCSRAPDVEAPRVNAADAQEGETIFQTRCFVCHGREGRGNGPASTGLGATVRDLTNPSWQDSTSDETIARSFETVDKLPAAVSRWRPTGICPTPRFNPWCATSADSGNSRGDVGRGGRAGRS